MEKMSFTNYNGERRYLVKTKGKNVKIYTRNRSKKFHIPDSKDYKTLAFEFKNVKKIFKGEIPLYKKGDPTKPYSKRMRDLLSGNTFLIQISDFDYIYADACVYKITLKGDQITKYISPDGNNDVFYPIAYGKKYVYFLGFEEKVPVSVIPKSLMDPQKEYLLTGVYANHQYLGEEGEELSLLDRYWRGKEHVSFNGYKSSIDNMKCLKEGSKMN
tara:strand:- start:1180 stop:1824 length:645 start_codon:yes stop_codon:yes gene_type:complete